MTGPILQFGTSRFLQAHAALMLSQARDEGQDVGAVTVVETTGSPASRARVAAFAKGQPYKVKMRGLSNGKVVDETHMVGGVVNGLSAREDMERLREAFAGAGYVVSNTGDRGFDVPDAPQVDATGWSTFPELLTFLLRDRFETTGEPLTILPCELITRNGDRLREIVLSLAARTDAGAAFSDWLANRCVFVNGLVDRIVSEPLEPLGAVAEPYGLWALEAQPGFTPPCVHPQVQVVDDLEMIANRKLFLLNLGHTLLAQKWLDANGAASRTVRDFLAEPDVRAGVEAVMANEVIPAFGEHAGEAAAYWRECLERFANPFLDHRLSDIATNHEAKIARRAGGLIEWARKRGSTDSFDRLKAALPQLANATSP